MSMENYFLLFTDNLVSSLILPIQQSFVFHVMLCFRSYYNITLMLLFGVLGSSLGGVINWYLGKMTTLIRKSYHKPKHEHTTSRTIKNLLILLTLLLSWAPPLGSVVQISCGYFKLNFYIFAFLTILSNLFYFLYLIVNA